MQYLNKPMYCTICTGIAFFLVLILIVEELANRFFAFTVRHSNQLPRLLPAPSQHMQSYEDVKRLCVAAGILVSDERLDCDVHGPEPLEQDFEDGEVNDYYSIRMRSLAPAPKFDDFFFLLCFSFQTPYVSILYIHPSCFKS